MSRPDIALRALSDARRAVAAWSAAVALLVSGMVAAYPSVRDQAADLTRLLDSYPDALKAFMGLSGIDYASGAGYLRAELFGFTVPLLLLVLAIGRGASSVAGEEDRGTLDLLLATPVRRRRVVAEKAAGVVAVVALVAGALWAALAASAAGFGLGVPPVRTAAAVGAAALLAVVFGMVALAAGAVTGRRGLAVGLATALATAAFVLESLARIIDGLRPWRWLSPFAYYRDADPLARGLPPKETAVLVAIALVAAVAGVTGFARRDVRGR
ncbi:MAG TPA: ABC transporter permease subunit [Frankiaceae bacterium]|nr:ABC transporter permease subunit [Frankiaceae bacterium]